MIFENRSQAGRLLVKRLKKLNLEEPIVLALPRGGVPIGYEVAKALQAPLETFIVRKIGAPKNPEFAIGAIAEGNHYWINRATVEALGISDTEINSIIKTEKEEISRRSKVYREGRDLPPLRDRSVVLVDDGIATGSTAAVACKAIRVLGAREVILATPICARESEKFLDPYADELICLERPTNLFAIGMWYEDFSEVGDDDVIALLRSARQISKQGAPPRTTSQEVMIKENGLRLLGNLAIPNPCQGFVLFAHGSGSSRHSPRNLMVAKELHRAGFGTLLFDLLTVDEEMDRSNIFDIPLLAQRLVAATRWFMKRPEFLEHSTLPVGYFGASTGGAAALWAAAELGSQISGVVSRGGRPDLADSKLSEVKSPTLLIVGADDEVILELNEDALLKLKAGEITLIPGATHLFEEPGKLEEVAKLAVKWFQKNFRQKSLAA